MAQTQRRYRLRYDKQRKAFNLSPPALLACGFLAFILVGTLLLKLPFTHYHSLKWIDALFTACSAVTITGLSTVDIGSTFTPAGQMIILCLVQLGGLGFMTFAVLAALSLHPKLKLTQQKTAQEAFGGTGLGHVTFVAKRVIQYSLFFEFLGFAILSSDLIPKYGALKGAFYSLFFSISSFNNAGFSIFNDSLASVQYQIVLCLSISALYIIGGIGFLVLMDIQQQRRWHKLSTNSKLVLTSILLINLVAFSLIWLLEGNNHATLGHLPFKEQAVNAWFQATAPRSSGLSTVDAAHMHHSTALLQMLLMFIGGGSLSTAGGIKVGTFVILILSVISFLRRNEEVRVFNHSVPQTATVKALAVTSITGMVIFSSYFLILIFEPNLDSFDLLFEVFSAACTVGLSRGLTGSLQPHSALLLCFLMFFGRLGPLTLVYLIATPQQSRLKHAPAQINIG